MLNTVVLLLWVRSHSLIKTCCNTENGSVLSECTFPSLHSRCEVSAVGLLRTLLDLQGRVPLQQFCPSFATAPLPHFY